jgi:hypothetical protein
MAFLKYVNKWKDNWAPSSWQSISK